ncbi:insulin isoform X1 [Rhipicephalus sanguineus]|uniref:insulin isoform X1 n=1 Tax=Rhipicephalus sanguineus TaxID=34632 RepID=UPI001895D199|nr:insulin isoform X1 [Rhipicephalus sanguineus]
MPSSPSAANVAGYSLLLLFFALAASSLIEKRTRFCGPYLVETLEALCGGEYFDPAQKRHIGLQQMTLQPMLPPWAMEPRLGFLDAKTALQLLRPASHRQVRGIIEECCHKPCAVAELLSYCGRVRPASTDE